MSESRRTITVRMDSVLDDMKKEFQALTCKEDFEAKVEKLREAGKSQRRFEIMKELFSMLDARGISYERGKEYRYYKELVEKADLPSQSELESSLIQYLFTIYEKYPKPEDYMLRIVDRLCDKEDGWGEDSLRLRILKQFVKYGGYLADAGYGGRGYIRKYAKKKVPKANADAAIADAIDDGVFDCLQDAKEAQLKPGGTYGVLKVADDLAFGKFRSQGATKRALYMFAFVYNMTFYAGGDGASFMDPETDIERNLFEDYYANNLMRYITETYRGKLSEFELDVSGQGINYKNFAEVIYLYYLWGQNSSADSENDCQGQTPIEKIKRSAEMIEACKNNAAGTSRATGEVGDAGAAGTSRATSEAGDAGAASTTGATGTAGADVVDTVHYKAHYQKVSDETISCEFAFNKSEEEFQQFILDNYDCSTIRKGANGKGDTIIGIMQVQSEQNSAMKVFREITERLMDSASIEDINYGLWFADAESFGKNKISEYRDDFAELLKAVDSYMRMQVTPDTEDLSETRTSDNITRTSILSAFYYMFNEENMLDDTYRGASFSEVYDAFESEVNEYLERANYQKLSSKNIFDVLLVFSAYAYANL